MTETKHGFTKKKAVLLVLGLGLLLLALVLIRWKSTQDDLSTPEGREKFLASLGWQVDMDSESFQTVLIPGALDGVMAEYNRLQLQQGYDLSRHLGEKCQQYSYILTNYPDTGCTVFICLYVQGRSIIAGDIHTSSIDGFMHGIKRDS